MKVQVISAFCLSPGQDAHVGEVIEMADHAARHKIALGYVVPVPPEPAPADSEHPEVGEEATVRDPEPEHRDPRRARGRKED